MGLCCSAHPPPGDDARARRRPSKAPRAAAERPRWVPDAGAAGCEACRRPFSVRVRRHHCRRCGRVFCGACSVARRILHELGYETPQRTCTACTRAVDHARAAAARSVNADGGAGAVCRTPVISSAAPPPEPAHSPAIPTPRPGERAPAAPATSRLANGTVPPPPELRVRGRGGDPVRGLYRLAPPGGGAARPTEWWRTDRRFVIRRGGGGRWVLRDHNAASSVLRSMEACGQPHLAECWERARADGWEADMLISVRDTADCTASSMPSLPSRPSSPPLSSCVSTPRAGASGKRTPNPNLIGIGGRTRSTGADAAKADAAPLRLPTAAGPLRTEPPNTSFTSNQKGGSLARSFGGSFTSAEGATPAPGMRPPRTPPAGARAPSLPPVNLQALPPGGQLRGSLATSAR